MNRQKREQQILDDALKTFIRQGYSTTSVSDLVKDANVSRGTFYLYFKSKEEVFDCLIDRFMSDVLHYVSVFDADHISKNHIRFSSICHNLAMSLAKYRLLCRFIMIHSTELTHIHRAKINAYIKQCYRILEFNINNGIKMGEFKPYNAKVVARCLIGSIKEFLLEWSAENEAYDLETNIYNLLTYIRNSLCIGFDSDIHRAPETDNHFISDTHQHRSTGYQI